MFAAGTLFREIIKLIPETGIGFPSIITTTPDFPFN